jgi:hypothetical protein
VEAFGEFMWTVSVPIAAAAYMILVFVARSRQRP